MSPSHRSSTGLLVILAISLALAFSTPATAKGLFDQKDHLTELKLDTGGSNGWSAALKKTDSPGAIFYPGEAVGIDIVLKNSGKENLSAKPILEVV
ncbi:MAG: hypothetical protein QF662_09305, partial [Phycisphaerae bacterium]|nr:hypothetical protein [Phycisphaerae bacterium]